MIHCLRINGLSDDLRSQQHWITFSHKQKDTLNFLFNKALEIKTTTTING